ncbi:Putative DNA-binding protein in cluster with Type I restriction-modification system, partial [uncultured Gammaproteobacteria bacterium]
WNIPLNMVQLKVKLRLKRLNIIIWMLLLLLATVLIPNGRPSLEY